MQNTMSPSDNDNEILLQRMLTVSEVAEILHVHPNTVRIWSDNGLIKVYRVGYRQDRRFRLKDIHKFLTV
jgi:excisionase family DNA binding protein